MQTLEEKAKALSEYRKRHEDAITSLLIASIRKAIADFGGQIHASRYTTMYLGYPLAQGTISKALNSEKGLWRVHEDLTSAYNHLSNNPIYANWNSVLGQAFSTPPRYHQLGEITTTKTPCFLLSLYTIGNEVRAIVHTQESQETHVKASELELY